MEYWNGGNSVETEVREKLEHVRLVTSKPFTWIIVFIGSYYCVTFTEDSAPRVQLRLHGGESVDIKNTELLRQGIDALRDKSTIWSYIVVDKCMYTRVSDSN